MEKSERNSSETFDELRCIRYFEKLLQWAVEEGVKKEDLATTCKIFLVTYEASSERRAYGLPSSSLLCSDYFG